jgi:hypothetical protein
MKVTLRNCLGADRPQSRPTEIAAPINRKIVNGKLPTLSTARDDAKWRSSVSGSGYA